MCLSVRVPAIAAGPESGPDSTGLAATAAVPWNPPAPAPASLPWETALRLPGRLATLPLAAAGQVTRRTLLVVEEKSLVPRVLFALQILPRTGLTLAPASLGDRTGLGGRFALAPPPLGGHLVAEHSASTRHYNRTRVALSAGPARLEYLYDWRPQDRFHGAGMSSRLDDTTQYSSTVETLALSLSQAWTLAPGTRPARVSASVWTGGRGITVGRGREDEIPSLVTAGPGIGPFVAGGTQWVGGVSASIDTRSGRPHWARGERLSLALERTAPRDGGTLLLHGTSGPEATGHTLVTAELETGVSFWRDPRTLRLLARVEKLDPDGDPAAVPLPDLPALGGSRGLSGFDPGRFHDLAAVLARASYVFPLAQHFEMDAHVETGGVFPALRAARAADLEVSYGVFLRPRMRTAPLAAIGVEWSRESVRVRYTLGGVE